VRIWVQCENFWAQDRGPGCWLAACGVGSRHRRGALVVVSRREVGVSVHDSPLPVLAPVDVRGAQGVGPRLSLTQAAVFPAVFRRITHSCSCCTARPPANRTRQRCWPSLTSGDWTRLRSTREKQSPPGQLAVSEDECRDVLWATLDGALWHQLVAERGWSDERFAAWLSRLWVTTLVTV
jgi:hypothetical protein